jgi:hypothetical protein
MSATHIKYQDTALPASGATVTLFNSVTAFPPGGSFHLLNQQWFQWSINAASDTGAATGTVNGQFSVDKGVTWVTFYTEGTTSGNDPATINEEDEVYVGLFKDIRFQYVAAGGETLTTFDVQITLNDCKPTSKVTVNDVLVDG